MGNTLKNEYPHSGFAKRLNHMMLVRNLTNKDMAELLHLSQSAISGYRTGRRAPDIDVLVRLADILCVSTDYLLEHKNYY